MREHVAYYRVSTDRQGASGLGLDAQRQAVARHIGTGTLAAEFTEIESGRRDKNRPQLAAALQEAKKRRAVLVIAKLDRLARNVHFVSGLMESGVEFVAADMPTANRLTIHVMAAFAEHEREAISQRTREGLAAAKARGTVLGNPNLAEARKAAAAVTRTTPPPEVIEIMRDRRSQGDAYRAIAGRLNRLDIRTPRGSRWHGKTVRDQLERAKCP